MVKFCQSLAWLPKPAANLRQVRRSWHDANVGFALAAGRADISVRKLR
jgi:hypothetical protein